MKKSSEILLKLAVILMGVPAFAIGVFLLPRMALTGIQGEVEFAFVLLALTVVLYATFIPFYLALYQAYNLIGLLRAQEAFASKAIQVVQGVKKYMVAISTLYVLALPFFFIFAEVDDAPGVVLVGAALVFVPFVVGVAAKAFEALLMDGLMLKSENKRLTEANAT